MAGSQNKKVAEIEQFDFLINAYSTIVKLPRVVNVVKKIRNDLQNYLK